MEPKHHIAEMIQREQDLTNQQQGVCVCVCVCVCVGFHALGFMHVLILLLLFLLLLLPWADYYNVTGEQGLNQDFKNSCPQTAIPKFLPVQIQQAFF